MNRNVLEMGAIAGLEVRLTPSRTVYGIVDGHEREKDHSPARK